MPLGDLQEPIAQVRERLMFPDGPADADGGIRKAQRQFVVVDEFERGLDEWQGQERIQKAARGDGNLNRFFYPVPDAVAGEALDMLNARQRGIQQLFLQSFGIRHCRWSLTNWPGRF
jgi:hypothetical protein